MQNFNYLLLLELINLEVDFWQKIKKSKSKSERSLLFSEFYPILYEKATMLWGSYGNGFDSRVLNAIATIITGKRVLELGCGQANFYSKAEQLFEFYCGIDITARNKILNKGEIVQLNVLTDTVTSKVYDKFDIIYSNDFVEHIYEPDLIDLFDELIKNKLNKNGVIITVTPNILVGHGDAINHLNIPTGNLFGSHLTLKTSEGWAKFYEKWGGKSKVYGGSYMTSNLTRWANMFFLSPRIHDIIIQTGLRKLYRVPQSTFMLTKF